MKPASNIAPLDRAIRLILSEALLIFAFFWGSGWAEIGSYLLVVILLSTSIVGLCPIYHLFGRTKTIDRTVRLWEKISIGSLVILLAIGGSMVSAFLTKKIFLEDFSAMNQYYKQSLFASSKTDRAATIQNYESLVRAYDAFSAKYTDYRPYQIRSDRQFIDDLAQWKKIIDVVSENVSSGSLLEVHLGLEPFRPIFQEMFKRNGFSMLSVYLVDFHDPMENVIAAADAKDPKRLLSAYPDADEKLRAVETEANDADIAAIRSALDELKKAAEASNSDILPSLASRLKSAFATVYLKRG